MIIVFSMDDKMGTKQTYAKRKKKTKYMDRIYKWIQLQNEWSPFAKTLVT